MQKTKDLKRINNLYGQPFTAKNQGNVQRAYALCEDILKISPKQPEPLSLMGLILAESGRKIDALGFLTRALEVVKDPSVFNNRGNLYQGFKQFELALDDYDAALKLNPKFTEAHYNKGNCYKEMNEFAKQAIDARFGGAQVTGIELSELLKAERDEDDGNTLWKVFNRVQEKIVGGSFTYVNEEGKLRKARPIKNFQQDMALNGQLWEIAEQFVAA